MTDRQGHRVVITGIGAVSPSGIGKEPFWRGLKEGRSATDRISFFDPSAFPSQVGAEARNFRPQEFLPQKAIKRTGRAAHLAVAAAKMAFDDSRAALNSLDSRRVGVVVGSSVGGMDFAEPEFRTFFNRGVKSVSPFAGVAVFCASVSSEVSTALKLKGASLTISTGCTSAIDAMGCALNAIRLGMTELIVTGGADACVTPGVLAAFCQMGTLSINYNAQPWKASRPFSKDRDGFVLGEGGWVLVFEELQHALNRGAPIYAEVLGYGSTCDAYHMTNPHPSGRYSAEAIRTAIRDSGIQPTEVDYFSAYGNATKVNDTYETKVIKKVFGPHAYKLAISSIKSMIGHAIGAAGAAQVAVAALTLTEGFVTPTINYENADPTCDLDYVPNVGRPVPVRVALCNCLSFGGKNAALVLRRHPPDAES